MIRKRFEKVGPVAGAALALGLLVAVSAQAEEKSECLGRRGPPPEAFAACEAAQEGDPCAFEGRRGAEVAGTCGIRREEVVCIPEGHRSRMDRREKERFDEDL